MKKRQVVRQIGFAVAGVTLTALAVWWWRHQNGVETVARAPVDALHDETLDGLPANSTAFGAAPLSEHEVSARPRTRVQRSMSGDDYGAIGVDDLGPAFLARATDGLSSADDGDYEDSEALADSAGFHVITPREK